MNSIIFVDVKKQAFLMKQKYTTLIALFVLTLIVKAQDLQVVSSAGGDTTLNTVKVSWTIGEPLSGIGYSDTNFLTQGFQQSNLRIWLFETPKSTKINYSVYPNPSSNFFFLKVSELKSGSRIQIQNIEGKIIHNSTFISNPYKIDLTHSPSGLYLLRVIEQNKNTTTFKILKN